VRITVSENQGMVLVSCAQGERECSLFAIACLIATGMLLFACGKREKGTGSTPASKAPAPEHAGGKEPPQELLDRLEVLRMSWRPLSQRALSLDKEHDEYNKIHRLAEIALEMKYGSNWVVSGRKDPLYEGSKQASDKRAEVLRELTAVYEKLGPISEEFFDLEVTLHTRHGWEDERLRTWRLAFDRWMRLIGAVKKGEDWTLAEKQMKREFIELRDRFGPPNRKLPYFSRVEKILKRENRRLGGRLGEVR